MKGSLYTPIYSYLNSQRLKHCFTIKQINEFCGVKARANHYFGSNQFEFVTEEHYNTLRKHMDLKPHEEKPYRPKRRGTCCTWAGWAIGGPPERAASRRFAVLLRSAAVANSGSAAGSGCSSKLAESAA